MHSEISPDVARGQTRKWELQGRQQSTDTPLYVGCTANGSGVTKYGTPYE